MEKANTRPLWLAFLICVALRNLRTNAAAGKGVRTRFSFIDDLDAPK